MSKIIFKINGKQYEGQSLKFLTMINHYSLLPLYLNQDTHIKQFEQKKCAKLHNMNNHCATLLLFITPRTLTNITHVSMLC